MFGCTRSIPSQSSVPAGLTLASGSGFCFQCQVGSSLVLRRPIEITRPIVHWKPSGLVGGPNAELLFLQDAPPQLPTNKAQAKPNAYHDVIAGTWGSTTGFLRCLNRPIQKMF
jgi:hypothetical protein